MAQDNTPRLQREKWATPTFLCSEANDQSGDSGMKNEFNLAFNEVLEEKQLPKDVIIKALESAMASAYRKAVNASNGQAVEAKIDLETGKFAIFAEKEIVDDVLDHRTEVTLEDALKADPAAEMGGRVMIDSTPADFGRVAAQTARQVIQQRIREAERMAQIEHFDKLVGEIINGVVQAVNVVGATIGLDMKAEGILARKEMIPGERFRVHDRVRALVAEVKDNPRGPQIILSRTHRNFLRRLLENEVPEIFHGVVEIRSIAREPGARAKVAVSATQQGIDPVGACVGIHGVRIQAIVRELHDEKIDVIEWNNDPVLYIAKAISPARVSGVYLVNAGEDNRTATVVVPEDQLSLAIGRDGQNARLAARLTGWRIDIKSLPEAATDAITKLKTDPALAPMLDTEMENLPAIEALLVKKAEGRPLMPEEYDQITYFVDRIERRTAHKQEEKLREEESRLKEVRAAIPESAFSTNILDANLPEHIAFILQEAEIGTLGDLVQQMRLNPDVVLALQGIGPKAMQTIQEVVEAVPAVVKEEPVEQPVEEAPVAVVEAESGTEPVAAGEEIATGEVSTETPEAAPAVEGETEEVSLEELFTLKPEILVAGATGEEEEEGSTPVSKDKKKKKKKYVEVVYDPDRDITTARKMHKREDGTIEWEE
jgi:N utilization substance protein A